MSIKNLSVIFLIIIVFFIYSFTYAEKEETLADISKRVDVLEGQRDNLRDHIKNKSESLDLQFSKLETQLKSDYDYLKLISLIFGSITIIIIFGLFIKLRKRIPEIAEEKINKKFDRLLDEKKSRIINIIEKYNEEIQLKKEKFILVLSPADADDSFMKKFFPGMGFLQYDFKSVDTYIDTGKADLILLNNSEKKKFDDELLTQYISKTRPDTICFYFGPHLGDRIKLKNNTTSGNIRAQLYGNLVDALRYQKLLK